MRSRCRALFLLLMVVGWTLVAIPANAERTQADLVIVRPDDVVTEDLYAAGNAVRVEGRIEGDLYAVAFNDVTISGEVTGDVVVTSARVEVTGTIGGSLRAVASTVIVNGTVADDVFTASWTTSVGGDGEVGRDLLAWSNRINVEGLVGRNFEGQGRSTQISGTVEGTVDIVTSSLTVADSARVAGDLIYQSGDEATIGEAEVGGSIVRRTALPPNVRLRGLRLLTYTLAIFGVGALAMALTWAWPSRVESAVAAARRATRSWVTGILVALSPLAVAGVLALLVALSPTEAGLPLALVLLPLVIGLAGMVLVAGVVGLIPVAGLLGRLVVKKRSTAFAVLVGFLALVVGLMLPLVKWLVVLVLVPIGIGAWVRHLGDASAPPVAAG